MKTAEDWVRRLRERNSPLRFVASGEWLRGVAAALLAQGITDEGLIEELIDGKLQREQDGLMGLVVASIGRVVGGPAATAGQTLTILDIGVATGELPLRLRSLDLHQLRYVGIDFAADLVEETKARLGHGGGIPDGFDVKVGDALDLAAVVEPASVALAIWGKFGEHLTERAVWEAALGQVDTALMSGGRFLLYEPLRDGNPFYEKNPRKNSGTFIRSFNEYDSALSNYCRVETAAHKFCDELYAIAVWQKIQ